MSGYWGHAIGVITVLLLIAFIAIWIWAWRPRYKQVFDRMARVPLDNDDDRPAPQRGEGDRFNEGEGGDRR